MLGNIVERSNGNPAPPSVPSSRTASTSGFPTIVHRSQKPKRPSAFAAASARQARDTGYGKAVDYSDIPHVGDKSSLQPSSSQAGPSKPRIIDGEENEYSRIQRDVGDENLQRIAGMTMEEREEEIGELEERFGSSVMEALRKRAEKRARGGNDNQELNQEGSNTNEGYHVPSKSAPVLPNGTSSSSEAGPSGKSVRFDTTTIPPPSPETDLKSKYFPNTPAEPDKTAWMSPIISTPSSSQSKNDVRFDLSGRLLSSFQQSDLPTHLGLHHHGDHPDMAGYTIAEILHLCRSTVPAQRVGMMGLLSKVIALHVLTEEERGQEVRRICDEVKGCDKAVSLCVDIMQTTRNVSLLQVAIDLLYTALGGPIWSTTIFGQTSDIASFQSLSDAYGRAAPISSIPFEDLLHRLSELLNTPDFLPPISTQQLTLILRRGSMSNRETAEMILPLLPNLLQSHVTSRPWPVQAGKIPSIEPIRLMGDLIASSRLCASEIVEAELPGAILRFCVVSTWSDDDYVGLKLCTELLSIFGNLARYGLSAGIARSAHEIWSTLGEYISTNIDFSSEAFIKLAEFYFLLLEGWITCAIDPHRTTPEHDLTWTQIAGLGWADQAIDMIANALKEKAIDAGSSRVLVAAFRVLTAWAVGLGVNGVKGGEMEKEELGLKLGALGLAGVISARIRDQTVGDVVDPEVDPGDDELILATLRLRNELSPSSPNPIISDVDIAALSSLQSPKTSRYIRYELSYMILKSSEIPQSDIVRSGLDLLTAFLPGDEPLALDLLDGLLKLNWSSISPSMSSSILNIGNLDSLTLLRPLLQHAILPNVSDITAPAQIHHLYLKATGTLRSSPTAIPDETARVPPGLPLRPEWFFHPIDELLHSADSAAFQQAPIDWSPTELEIVRATLMLVRLALEVGYQMDRSTLLFGLMKVYMLEHQTMGMVDTGESEVFRDDLINECLGSLMDRLTISGSHSQSSTTSKLDIAPPISLSLTPPSATSSTSSKAGLEMASIPFLGLEPFYQFYTDLVALFENTSFGDATFARILLPPLSMVYPPDYRKIVWGNPNVIRLLRTAREDVPLESSNGDEELRGFFEPIESDPEVLSFYGQALVKGWVKPTHSFLWSVAIYHLKSFFDQAGKGPEGDKTSEGEKEKEIALNKLRKGLKDAVMGSGNQVVVSALEGEVKGEAWRRS